VRKFFALAQRKSDSSTFVALQLLVYGGLRIKALSQVASSDIIKTDFQKGNQTESKFSVRVRKAKGGKTRVVSIKKSIGLSLWTYAQSLNTAFLFPSKNNVGKPISSQSISRRIKRLAKNKIIGRPEISCHFFRHFFASNALENGASLADIQRQLGHSSINTTSVYLHASNQNVSALIDLSFDNEDDTVSYKFIPRIVKIEPKKNKSKTQKI